MLELQDAMNSKVHPQWRSQNFSWYRAIWVECAELMDHYGWKWWKKQSPDEGQVILELIDIWHFGLSTLLMADEDNHRIAGRVEKLLQVPTTAGDFREDLEAFCQQTLISRSFDVPLFAVLMQGVDLSFDRLYRSYIGKNVLNFFRQNHGYKEGTYKKLWQGREDNEHLVEALGELDSNRPEFKDELYQALVERYQASY